jgi:glycosyltransferase involved in cell wall biosynthesis
MSAADVTVVVPLYDRAGLIGHTLDSLEPRRHPGVLLDVVVVDDGSTDGGAEVVAARFPGVRLLRQRNLGAPAARNAGLEAARADAVLYLDSDDIVEPGFFAPRLGALAAHASADGAYGPWAVFGGDGACDEASVLSAPYDYPVEPEVCVAPHLLRLLRGRYLVPHAVLWRRGALERIGGHDPSLSVNQDVDLMFRVLLSGAGIVGCEAPRAWYRVHAGARQGAVRGSRRKAEDVLRVRREFVRALAARGLDGPEARRNIAADAFEYWEMLRTDVPDVAEAFYELSRGLVDGLPVEARWSLRALARVVGPKWTIHVRDTFRFIPDAVRRRRRDWST